MTTSHTSTYIHIPARAHTHTHTHTHTQAHKHTRTHTEQSDTGITLTHWTEWQRESHSHTLNTVTQRIPLTHWTDWHRENPTDCTHTKHSENPTDCTHTEHSENPTDCTHTEHSENPTDCTHTEHSENPTDCTHTEHSENPTDCTHTEHSENPTDCTHTKQSHTQRESHWLYRYGATAMGAGLGRRPAGMAWFLCVQRGVEGPAIGRGPRGLITLGDTGWTITRCLTSENQSSRPCNTKLGGRTSYWRVFCSTLLSSSASGLCLLSV